VKTEKISEIFAKRIKELRLEKNLSQREVAKFLGISQPSYIRYELKTGEPSLTALAKLAQLYQVTVGCLLGIEDY